MNPSQVLQLAVQLHQQGKLDQAEARYWAILNAQPNHFDAKHLLGVLRYQQGRHTEAVDLIGAALKLKPNDVSTLSNFGLVLVKLGQSEEALASYDKALSLKPDYAEAHNHRGTALNDLKRPEEALASYDRALSLKPDHADAHYNRGNALRGLKRPEEALASYDRALSLKPDHQLAFSSQVIAAFQACYWARAGELSDALSAQMAVGQSRITPFSILGFCDDPSAQLACARHYIQKTVHPTPAPLSKRSTRAGGKIRIAYLSADFHRHATAWLTAELFELHNRAKFEVFGISFGKDDRSGIRRRLTKAFDGFHDVQHRSNRDVAQLISDLQIDIAIDLKGYTQDSRPAILAYRPAPVQVSYLGYPGTMGADFIDYLVADRFVAPFDQQPYFAEQIVHLPDSYQVNDTKRSIAASTPTRLASGLPEQGFVYCCFNNNYKITPKLFDVWMRLISGNPGSVLWLLRDNADAERNLRKEAEARGVDSTRLVFAGRLPLDEHLARHRLADLFLDTLPCNAHTTASDALWAELPVLTCMGHSFVSRVASSLLHAVGLPELVTDNLSDYEALARRLSADPVLLGGYKQRLAQNRLTCPLFDSARFTRHIEAAYAKMWELHQRGESPRSLSIEPA